MLFFGFWAGSMAGTTTTSAAGRNILPVLPSKAIVLALAWVDRVCTASYLSGDTSWMTLSVPSPFETKIMPSLLLNPAASGPFPMGRLAIVLPLVASITTSTWLWHAMNNRLFLG